MICGFIDRFGISRILVSDNGTQFNGKKITEYCIEMGIHQKFMAITHPQVNGQVKVINRVLMDGLKKRMDQEGGSWVDEIPSMLYVYRTTQHSMTGE